MKRLSLIVVSIFLVTTLLAAFIVLPEATQSIFWKPEMEISTDAGTEDQWTPSIAADNDRVHVAWQDRGDGDWDIYYRYFDGANWQPEQEISSDGGTEDQFFPSITVDGSKVHIVWEDRGDGDYDVYYRCFDGTSWQPEQEISTDAGTEWQDDLSIAADDGKVHVVWVDDGDGDSDVHYRQFNGTSWQPEREISTDIGNENQSNPSIAVDGDRAYVVWEDRGDGDPDIYYKYFDGANWQPEQEISTDPFPTVQWMPSIAVDGEKVHVVWGAWPDFGDYDIYYRQFNGTSWQPEQEISTDIGTEWQWRPKIAVDSGGVHVVWHDRGDGDYDIYHRYFDGKMWQPEQEVSTDIFGERQLDPTVAADRGIVHVVWEDEVDGDFDIYYAKGAIAPIPLPPSGLNAILSGDKLENVTLSWDLSPDDGAGLNSVVGYLIYRNMTYDPIGLGYSSIAFLPAGTSEFIDSLVGEGDPNDYFYRVCAFDQNISTSCAGVQAGKFTRPLSEGSNLISVPLVQSDESTEKVLQTVQFDKAWSFFAVENKWKWFMTFKPYKGDLKTIDHRMGIWVNVTGGSNLTVAGLVPTTTSINLHGGWNLVGFPSFTETCTVSDLKASLVVESVEGFDASAPPYFLRTFMDGEFLLTGSGYWINTSTDDVWTVINF